MTGTYQLSINMGKYLDLYQLILDEMITEMSAAPMTDSISGSFIGQMIPHHRAAIEMSENLLQYTTNIPLQDIALNIISEQKKSVRDMEGAYSKCKTYENAPRDLTAYRKENKRIDSTPPGRGPHVRKCAALCPLPRSDSDSGVYH